ncbi:hypothetical protein Tco_1082619 [Tanacetum coccineum]|uniref:Reverse transcriptase domain-containing protein n=1 Tax=Tanacetum coccineum TaxID=301880 RepID=A0ABQ5I120_9ASTR
MPLESPKPPDPILKEFHTLTGMTSEDIHHKPFCPSDEIRPPKSRGRPKGVKNRPKGVKIKVQSPGSASSGAGAILKRVRNSKIIGKGRSRSESSHVDVTNGKRSNSSNIPVDDVLTKVLDRIAYDKSISEQMVFSEGVKDSMKVSSNAVKINCDVNHSGKQMVNAQNDGSFINDPIRTINDENVKQGVRSDKVVSSEEFNMVDGLFSTNVASGHNMADVEHVVDPSTINVENEVHGSGIGEAGFVFGDSQKSKGILKKPSVGLTSIHFGPRLFNKVNSSSVWNASNKGVNVFKYAGALNIESFAEKMKKGVEERELQMNFAPQFVSKQENGSRRIDISVEDIEVDIKDWVYYFKFKSEEGMKAVFESGPWMVNNVPLVLNVWEPGIWLEKVEPSLIPIWVCAYNIPMELCNGNGKLDFARVLVEVVADDELPNTLEIAYPQLGNRSARVGKLEVKYQWKPPLCSHCKTFVHPTSACKARPRTEEEIAAKELKAASKGEVLVTKISNVEDKDDDGFVIVGRKNRPVVNKGNANQSNDMNKNSSSIYFQNRGAQRFGRQNFGSMKQSFSRQGPNQQVVQQNKNVKFVPKASLVQKPELYSKYNSDYRPKVLVKGSGSNSSIGALVEDVPVTNSFHVLGNCDMVDKQNALDASESAEYEDVIWPKLKMEVENLMKSGKYPSAKVKMGWSLSQLDYFYKNCEKFGMEPYSDEDVGILSSGRNSLWKDLCIYSIMVKDMPWLLMGDFNVIKDPNESFAGSSKFSYGMEDFRECLSNIEVDDILIFLMKILSSCLLLLRTKPAVLSIPNVQGAKHKPFKFANFLASKAEFLLLVRKVWDEKIIGYSMFSVVSKLKRLKKPLIKLKFAHGDLTVKVKKLKEELCRVQAEMVNDPHNKELRFEEITYLKAYNSIVKDEELFLKQRSKISWLSEGDYNTRYFHNAMKERRNRNRIEYVEDVNRVPFVGDQVGDQFVHHFGNVLGRCSVVQPISDPDHLFTNKLSIDRIKSPGPDGFSAKFFKALLSIVGSEVCQAVKDLFSNGKLLKEVNATIIALVPKCQSPSKVSDYRPIACCNVLYKCISKVIANRLKGVLNSLVNDRQSAFIPTRQISDNILLTQELLRNYHRNIGPSKVVFKINIQKAYDSLYVSVLKSALEEFSGVSGLMPSMEKSKFISKRDIYEAGLSLSCKVADIVRNGEWIWPNSWYVKFLFLTHLPPLQFRDKVDTVLWKDKSGKNILRHAFITWLAINRKVKTQDSVALWQNIDNLKCSLCQLVQDSHSLLFIGCEFSSKVWLYFKDKMKLEFAPNQQERTLRLFQDKFSSVDVVCGIVREHVRLRLLSSKIRRSKQSPEATNIWKFHVMDRDVECAHVNMKLIKGEKSMEGQNQCLEIWLFDNWLKSMWVKNDVIMIDSGLDSFFVSWSSGNFRGGWCLEAISVSFVLDDHVDCCFPDKEYLEEHGEWVVFLYSADKKCLEKLLCWSFWFGLIDLIKDYGLVGGPVHYGRVYCYRSYGPV